VTQAQSTLVDDLTTIRRWAQAAPAVALPEIDTVNLIIGDAVNTLTAGIGPAIRVDFNAYVTGFFLQEFDGNSGSITIDIQKAPGGPTPAWTRISPATAPAIVTGRYFQDLTCETWDDRSLNRGDYLRVLITSVANIRRLHVGIRIRRLEP
jgi:hypothetical protein